MQGKLLRQVLDKMMTSGHAQNARVQVLLPDGKYYDITSLQLMENKLIGVRETHRLEGYLFSTSNCVPCETSTQYFYLSFRCLPQGSKTL
jgi:hypothetical protein